MTKLKKPASTAFKAEPTGGPPAQHPDNRGMDRKPPRPPEFGGQPGPEPTRFGDWEFKGRCTDF
jgi:hypothetical protein